MLISILKIGATITVLSLSCLAAAQTSAASEPASLSKDALVKHSARKTPLPMRLRSPRHEIVVSGTAVRTEIKTPSYTVEMPEIVLEFPAYEIVLAK